MKTLILGAILILLAAIAYLSGAPPEKSSPDPSAAGPVAQALDGIRVKHNIPALAWAVVVGGEIVATDAVGHRRHGAPERVTADDRFHIGSLTKSMTATVAAGLVEAGEISWTTTVAESFPGFAEQIHPDYRDVTLEQLLTHRSGAPGEVPGDLWKAAWAAEGTPAEQRTSFLKGILARKPKAEAGTEMIYSNAGYTIAGGMLERASERTWEALMHSMLFEPLAMDSAGFGAPATPGEVDQPWGHTRRWFSGLRAVPPGPGADNPLAISPAGAVHCSVGDLARYAAFHLAGEEGDYGLLGPESFRKLHTPVADGDYALGWVAVERNWAGGRALMHAGSNTMFQAVVWIAPERGLAVITAANAGGKEAFSACDEAAWELIQQFNTE